MGLKDRLNVAVKNREQARREQLEEDKKEFFGVIKQLFDEHPELKAIRWRQCTPYFNDGEPCTFGIGELFVQLFGSEIDEDGGDYEDGFSSTYYIRDTNGKLKEDVDAIESLMRSCEDAIEDIFGDGVTVTIERDKEPYTEEYSHD